MRNIPLRPNVCRDVPTRHNLAAGACMLGLLVTLASPSSLNAAVKIDHGAPPNPAPIIIRPSNYDPDDELAYMRHRGELDPGMAADGKVWDHPAVVQPLVPLGSRAAQMPASALSYAAGTGASPTDQAPAASEPRPMPMTYAQAYAQIPFSRSEYEANPGYRHDAAMEILFGQLRPTVISRTTTPYFSRYPDFFRYAYPVYPYSSR